MVKNFVANIMYCMKTFIYFLLSLFYFYNGTNKQYVECRSLHLQVHFLLFSSDVKSDI